MRHTASARVAVVGGGWAGLAAAVEATRLGDKVTLFEMASTLGGRARTVWLGQGSERRAFDNGQHILIGAYRETLRLMQLIGGEPDTTLLRTPLTLVDGSGIGLRLPAGHALVAFSRGVLSHQGWSFSDKARLLWMAARWAATGSNKQPVSFIAVRDAAKRQALHDLYQPIWDMAMQKYSSGEFKSGFSTQFLGHVDHFARHLSEVPVHIVVCAEWQSLSAIDANLVKAMQA